MYDSDSESEFLRLLRSKNGSKFQNFKISIQEWFKISHDFHFVQVSEACPVQKEKILFYSRNKSILILLFAQYFFIMFTFDSSKSFSLFIVRTIFSKKVSLEKKPLIIFSLLNNKRLIQKASLHLLRRHLSNIRDPSNNSSRPSNILEKISIDKVFIE